MFVISVVRCQSAQPLRRSFSSSTKVSPVMQQRSFMSTQAHETPEEDSHFLLILGPPGGGKGTISKKMLQDFPKFHHLSTGDLLRQHVREQTDLGKEAKQYMDSGSLVPDKLMIDLVMDDATPYLEEGKSLLLDGFPRTRQQAVALENVTHIDTVVNLDVPEDIIVDRIADRWIHAASGRIYSYSYHPPKEHGKDDVTGEALVQRDDDKPEAVRKRLKAYAEITSPLVRYYEKRGLCKTFKGTMSDVIYPKVKGFLEQNNFH